MSEYQHYEFLAIDEPLNREQMDYLRQFSTRAEITSNRFCDECHWGRFKGNEAEWMARFFDAHVCVSNLGVMTLMLRVPVSALQGLNFGQYECPHIFEVKTAGEYWVLSWSLPDRGEWGDTMEAEGESWMSRLIPIRDEILRGDFRSLYLGWLVAVAAGEFEDEVREPSPPPGLATLSAAQHALMEFLELGDDWLIAASQGRANEQLHAAARSVMPWLGRVSVSQKDDWLNRILTGDARQVESQLRAAFYAWQRKQQPGQDINRTVRTVGALRNLFDTGKSDANQQQSLAREEALKAQQAQREAYLRSMAALTGRKWLQIDELIQQGSGCYDQAVQILVDLSEAYKLCLDVDEFTLRLAKLADTYKRRSALLRCLKEAGL